MSQRNFVGFRGIAGFAAMLALLTGATAQWTVVNLHVGEYGSEVRGVGDGQQVGGTGYHACMWSGTAASWVSLEPAGAGNPEPSFANAASGGQQVGYARFGGQYHAGLWTGTAASWVDLNPAVTDRSVANGVGGGQQVGVAVVNDAGRASLWSGTAASWVNLDPLFSEASEAHGVSGGQQVGVALLGNLWRASLWTGTAASWVNLDPVGSGGSGAHAIGGGQIVGWASVGGVTSASLWTGTAASWVNLNPAGSTESKARGVSGGKQVGYAEIGGFKRASLWSGTAASWVDLHAFLPAEFESSYARGIWIDGVSTYVVGFGYNTTTGRDEALMWVSVYDPDNFTLTLNKATVAGQNSVLGTITVVETKPSNTVFTTYDNSSLVTTPPSVTVLAGQLSRNFQITVTAITSSVVTTIFAKRGTLTRSQTLTLAPLIPTAISFTPNPVTGGLPTSCRVVINGVAGPGGRDIAIFDNSPYATTPSTVTVPAGATSVTFPITTIPVTSIKYVTVTARVTAGEKTGTFRINP